MDRRLFLKTGASAVALAAAARGASAPPGATLKKAVKFGMVGQGADVCEKFQLVHDLGFDGIELDSPSDLDPEEVLRARDASGLTIHGLVDSVHWHHTLGDPDPAVRRLGVEALRQALADARRFGASTVLLVPGRVSKKVSYADVYQRSQAEICRVLPQAAELGVKIAIENVWNDFLLSPLEAARYVDAFESPFVGWYFDVGNIVNYGWPEHWIRTLGRRILKVDVKGFSRKKRNDEGLWKGFDVEIGEGDCDWPAVMAALADVGYSGWATAEVKGGGRERLAEIKRRMDQVLVF